MCKLINIDTRIAVHYKSPRLVDGERAFYELLKNIDVRETDGITSELHLQQDGKDLKVKVADGEIHIEEITDGLHIYVPWDAKAQYICFLDRIHKDLLEWILTEPSTAIFKTVQREGTNSNENYSTGAGRVCFSYPR